jgi:hypothetical protein
MFFNMDLRDSGFENWKMDGTGSGLSPMAGFGMSTIGPSHTLTRES